MILPRPLLPLAAGLAVVAGLADPAAADGGRVEAGRLTCVIDQPDRALHFGSRRQMECRFQPRHGRVQRYRGEIAKFGIEWGLLGRTVMRWRVLSRDGRVRRGGLAGSYGGLTLEGALGAGVGGNVVGGGPDGISLAGIGTQSQTGSVNLTTGMVRFSLRPVR